MTDLPSKMNQEERHAYIEKRKRRIEELDKNLDASGEIEKEKLIQEIYDARVVRVSSGLGDTVEKVIKKVTGKKSNACGGCKRRRDALNKAFPYKKK